MFEAYAEYGITAIVVGLFITMILNLIKSQKDQNEDLDDIRVHIGKLETTVKNMESIVIKIVDRFNKSDDTAQRHREDVIRELNDVTDSIAYLKGRLNGKAH